MEHVECVITSLPQLCDIESHLKVWAGLTHNNISLSLYTADLLEK